MIIISKAGQLETALCVIAHCHIFLMEIQYFITLDVDVVLLMTTKAEVGKTLPIIIICKLIQM